MPGIPWHIIQRGNNRSACFFTDEDYQLYLHHLKEQADKRGCEIHAYVLMTNHVHILLTPHEEDSASLLMKHLGQRYVQYVNRTYQRSGTLWEGRFRSCLTQNEAYVLACYRYIELNPVRAEMVKHPRDYPWSSYRFNAEGKANDILTPHDQYARQGVDEPGRKKAYRGLFKAHVDVGIDDQGNKRFQEQIANSLGRRVTKGKAGRPKRDRDSV